MKIRCHHDVKIEVLLKLFEATTKKTISEKTRLKSKKINKILEDFKNRNFIQELKTKDGQVLYHTTPKGRELVKDFKNVVERLEGEENNEKKK